MCFEQEYLTKTPRSLSRILLAVNPDITNFRFVLFPIAGEMAVADPVLLGPVENGGHVPRHLGPVVESKGGDLDAVVTDGPHVGLVLAGRVWHQSIPSRLSFLVLAESFLDFFGPSLSGYVVAVIKPADLVTASNPSISPARNPMRFWS